MTVRIPQDPSLKELAFAYAMAKAGSDVEKELLRQLVERIQGGDR